MNSTFYKLTDRGQYNAFRNFATVCFDVFFRYMYFVPFFKEMICLQDVYTCIHKKKKICS